MPAHRLNGTRVGIGRALKYAFAPDSPVDPALRVMIKTADGTYGPDAAAERRADRLLQRLEDLPWGGEPLP